MDQHPSTETTLRVQQFMSNTITYIKFMRDLIIIKVHSKSLVDYTIALLVIYAKNRYPLEVRCKENQNPLCC